MTTRLSTEPSTAPSPTSASTTTPGTPADVLRAARALAPTITARAPEIEAARRLPPDLVDQLAAAGCFRILLPDSHGGMGADLAAVLDLIEILARADASTGWTVAIGASAWHDVAGLPRPTFDALYARGPDAVVAGAFSPSGTAVAEDGGYRVDGRWAFASGCEHATWLFGNCMEEVDGDHRLRTVLFSPSEVEIEDTWDVAGLRGTGSHHFRARGVLVPAHRTFDTFGAEPCLDAPAMQVPAPALFALELASVAVGTGFGALDEVTALAADKVPFLAGGPLADSAQFQHELAVADTELHAARGRLRELAGEAWTAASGGTPLSDDQRARIRAGAAWATGRGAAAVATAYRAGGGGSIYSSSPLQRRLRDVLGVTQHFLLRPDTFTHAGALLLGREIGLPVF